MDAVSDRAYGEDVRMGHGTRHNDAALVTDTKQPMSVDIAFRERRYPQLMGIRVLCFAVTIVMFVAHAGWFSAIPAAGAIIIPYFAVVFANGGRNPSNTRGSASMRQACRSGSPALWERRAGDHVQPPARERPLRSVMMGGCPILLGPKTGGSH
jgi:hypothetical protein